MTDWIRVSVFGICAVVAAILSLYRNPGAPYTSTGWRVRQLSSRTLRKRFAGSPCRSPGVGGGLRGPFCGASSGEPWGHLPLRGECIAGTSRALSPAQIESA